MAIAKAIQGDDKEPLEFKYEKVEPASEDEPQAPPKIVTVKVEDNGLWEKLYQQLKAEKKEAKPKVKNQNQLTFF